jgi:transcriptional regulator with PAS, ATPase and Fis domain
MPSEPEASTTQLAPAPVWRVASVDVVVVEGRDRGKRATVTAGVARVGTAPNNALPLTDPTVSRVHCELVVGAERVTLRDVGSTNGTFVDGLRVREVDLPSGTLVRAGSTTLRVDIGEPTSVLELSARQSFGGVVGASPEMRRIYAVLEKVAPTDTTVLVTGETGTGKELVARALHDESPRARGPFVAIDCGALPESLIESELFGHVRGAFSGALGDRKGVFEEADGGTLFFDEIGELPVTLQPKLLRALETREVRRVGSNQSRRVDVRVIAATNRSLSHMINDGRFREDLYYRLAVVEIELPPLRARRQDIPRLAASFLERHSGEPSQPPPALLAAMMAREWPGNVRELRNFIERSVSLGFPSPAPVAETGLAPEVGALVPVHLPLKEAREAWINQFEEVYVRALLERTGNNVTRAAALAGVSRRFLQRTMVRIGIRSSADDEES